jgi:adenylylsulfate kinase
MRKKNDDGRIVLEYIYCDKKMRQQANGQRSFVVCLTGLSASGKSTIASALDTALYERNMNTYVLNGDNIRSGLSTSVMPSGNGLRRGNFSRYTDSMH